MRIQVFSDLHLEFAPLDLPAIDADVVVLAGDIHVGVQGIEWAKETFPDRPVLYVAGNHEYYGALYPELNDKLRAACAGSNVVFLEESELTIGGVRFLGATLWTDFLLFGSAQLVPAMDAAHALMLDYRRIQTAGYRKLRPRDTEVAHAQSRKWLSDALSRPHAGPTVVVTHHAPSLRSLAPRYHDDLVSAAFASDLHELLDGRAALWIHGHTHHPIDDRQHKTRVVTNQRGYPNEAGIVFDPGFVVEV